MNLILPKSLPDLSHLSAHSGRMALRRIFQSGGAKDRSSFALQLNAVRLADLALREYVSGREAVLQYHTEKQGLGVTFILRASGHFENCVLALERFIKHIKALRGAPSAHMELKRLLPRNLLLLRSGVESEIVELRHLLSHCEEKTLNGELPEDTFVTLLPLEDGLSLGAKLVKWSDLSAWLTAAHKCASDLADYMGTTE